VATLIVIVVLVVALVAGSRLVASGLRTGRTTTTRAALLLAAIWAALPLAPLATGSVWSDDLMGPARFFLLGAALLIFSSMFLSLRWLLPRVVASEPPG
jgi:hypothetical protein